ncbi:M28 family metallopeptidase [Sphingomonas morindae]|uniref:M28 family metallopeptidase n=1 Tax=Sphingomonas morindae TaxID=1541170 RepID=A0ABY4XAY6_9SPHN|nr:M28 family metallopeptidase [Sphingomonas morindae]USI74078.1 M28 family metallopeptidase [Sphingomonas morindae]
MRLALLLGLAMPALVAATAPAPQFDTARISNDIRTLASDAFEGRGPATAGEEKTVAYLIRQMQAAGLQPGGPLVNGRRGWVQDVPLLRSDIAGTPRLSIDGTPLAQGQEIAVRAPLNGDKQVRITDAPMVFVGYGVTAPERRWDDFKTMDVKGKILVVLINDPDFETGAGDFGGKAMTYYGRWTYKYEEAARRGALGTLIVHETAPASYGWNTVKNSNANTQFDIVRDQPRASHAPLEAWITRDEAVALFKASGLDFDAEKKAAQSRGFSPKMLKPRFSADYAADVGVIHSKNVLGRVEGAGHPDETVLYSAHWDHLGVGLPDARGDRIYNGAADNASGTAALLELGRAFAKAPRPDRSVVFLAVTAEEKGLLGSEYYANNPVYPLATTAGVFNMDGPFGLGAAHDFTISGSAKLGLLDQLTANAAAQGRHYAPDSRPEAGSFYRSDHFSFAKRGVPAISYQNGIDLVQGGEARGRMLRDAYTRDRYHQPADEWSPDMDLSAVPQALGLLFTTGEQLANSRDWPNWSQDSEFRAARDASAASRR